MSYYVYELRDPRDGSVFYVGKGKGSRIDQHEREADKGRQSRKCDRIRAIKAGGLCIVKDKVRHFANEQDAFDFEAELVGLYGLANLTNVVPGGGTARNGHTIYQDRLRISTAAQMVRRLGNGRVKSITINGSVLDLQSIVESTKRGAASVIARRGVEWANAIVKRFNVTFVVNG
jgi:hypothetical protein